MKKISIIIALLAISGAAWYGWSKQTSPTPNTSKAGAKGDGPMTPVSTVLAKRQDVPIQLTANASVSPLATVDLRPQVTNTIVKVHVAEGDMVKQGQLLFSLDQRNELASLARAKAQIAKDQATLQDLERQLQRSNELLAQQFISRGASDTLQTQLQAQRANLAVNQANLQTAQVALDYTIIKAPMSGRVGAINVHPGSLVQPSTSLLQISQLNPINLTFTVPEDQVKQLLAAQKNAPIAVQTTLAGSTTPLQGKLSFIDSAIDSNSGAIKLKAQFDNPEHLLWPGQYTSVSMTVQTLRDAVVVPIAAVVTNVNGKSVFTVAGPTAKLKPVTLVYTFGAHAVVTGIEGGEKIILDGRQNLRPGGKIKELSVPNKSDKAKSAPAQGDTKKDSAA